MSRFLIFILLGVSLIWLSACEKKYESDPVLISFKVIFSPDIEQNLGSFENPIPFAYPDEPVTLYIDIQAVDSDGLPMNWNGWVYITTVPGQVGGFAGDVTEDTSLAQLTNGVATHVTVKVSLAYADAYIWVEDYGYPKKDPLSNPPPQCNDGIDNDNNWYTDMTDPNCVARDDDFEGIPTFATGSSPKVIFADPTVRNVQMPCRDMAECDVTAINQMNSPLLDHQVYLHNGELFVTNVTNIGYYLVDAKVQNDGIYFNSLFIYTYSRPDNLFIADRLCYVTGGVKEHVGFTQLVFPEHEVYFKNSQNCGVENPEAILPTPVELSDTVLSGDDMALEPYESAVITIKNLKIATKFINCDLNDDGEITYGTPEGECQNACTDDPGCTELGSYLRYYQYDTAYFDTGGTFIRKFQIVRDMVREFDPLAGCGGGACGLNEDCPSGLQCTDGICKDTAGFKVWLCPERTMTSVTGNLKNVIPTASIVMWVIEPRYETDIVVSTN